MDECELERLSLLRLLHLPTLAATQRARSKTLTPTSHSASLIPSVFAALTEALDDVPRLAISTMPTKRKYDDYVLDRLVELGDSVPDDERVESAFKGVADTLAEEGHPGLNYTVLASYYWQLSASSALIRLSLLRGVQLTPEVAFAEAGKHYSQRDEEDDSNQATIGAFAPLLLSRRLANVVHSAARKAQRLQQKEHRTHTSSPPFAPSPRLTACYRAGHKWGRKQTHKWTEDEDDELENSIDGFGGVGAVGWHKIFNEFVANDADTRGGITESAMRAHWGQMRTSPAIQRRGIEY